MERCGIRYQGHGIRLAGLTLPMTPSVSVAKALNRAQ